MAKQGMVGYKWGWEVQTGYGFILLNFQVFGTDSTAVGRSLHSPSHHSFLLTWQSFYCTRQIKPKRDSFGFRLWVGTRLNFVPSSCSTYHILMPNKKTPIPSRLTYNWVFLHIVRLNFWTRSMSLGATYGWTFTHFKL